jgi:hypothetical protein
VLDTIASTWIVPEKHCWPGHAQARACVELFTPGQCDALLLTHALGKLSCRVKRVESYHDDAISNIIISTNELTAVPIDC